MDGVTHAAKASTATSQVTTVRRQRGMGEVSRRSGSRSRGFDEEQTAKAEALAVCAAGKLES
jgi:hypothetical protein